MIHWEDRKQYLDEHPAETQIAETDNALVYQDRLGVFVIDKRTGHTAIDIHTDSERTSVGLLQAGRLVEVGE